MVYKRMGGGCNIKRGLGVYKRVWMVLKRVGWYRNGVGWYRNRLDGIEIGWMV